MSTRYSHCSICGDQKPSDEHRCPAPVLRGIDAADSAAWSRELNPLAAAKHNLAEPDYATRLRNGFAARGDA